ncbi:MAG: tetratricopeptide repeat protein [Arthrobacter sp.]|uniref:hypothetical protein n=1 Tax=Arthrobacter sp. TaxID=1667 RepID=UPI0034934B36
MSALAERLRGILAEPQPNPLASPADARGWLELAYERAYGEDHDGAVRAAESGLALVGGGMPTAPAPAADVSAAEVADTEVPAGAAANADTALSLWGVVASVRHLSGEEDAAAEAARRRVLLLRALGRAHQADLEEHLGPLLFREPRPEEAAILEAALATHAASGAPEEVLADVRLPLAVCRYEAGEESALEDLEACAAAYRDGGRSESQAGALLYLAHGYAKAGQPQDALRKADELLALPVNRAMQAAVWMVKAAAHSALDNPLEAEGCAVRALELYSGAGVRRGAVSAAALVANLASQSLDQESAVAAWRIAVEQAERGEFGETWAVLLALGNQLMEAEEFLLAEEVLEGLASSLELAGQEADQARTLMSLGHCLRHQERENEALAAWDRAAGLFEREGLPGDAARALLSAGTLLTREEGSTDALPYFERAATLARRGAEADPAALPQALHALGHALCESGDADGLGHLDEAIRLADDHGAEWHSADFRDTRARSLWALGHGPEAVAAALEAADLFREAEDDDGSANAELFAAHVLAETGRGGEAVPMYRLIAEEHRTSVAHYYAAQLGLSAVLDGLGLPAQAREARQLADQALLDAEEDDPGSPGAGPADPEAGGDAGS